MHRYVSMMLYVKISTQLLMSIQWTLFDRRNALGYSSRATGRVPQRSQLMG